MIDCPINVADPADVARHQQLAAATLSRQKTLLQRQIAATDQQIDRLVYELYNLTREEFGIVEESAG